MARRAALLCLMMAVFHLGYAVPGLAAPDPLVTARRLYNEGKLDAAMTAAKQAAANPSTASAARLVIGRIYLEQYRQSMNGTELESARSELRAVEARALDQREKIELQVGLATLLFYEEHFGAAAELLEPLVESSATLAPDAHERALDWWATALERQAQLSTDRVAAFMRISDRMARELGRDPSSTPANYWLAAAARAAGDLDRAMAAACAGWIRAGLIGERGVPLRADLDRLVTEAIIPDKAARLPQRDRRQGVTTLTADWEDFKKIW